MATRFAIASGNWSNTAIWDNGALPQPGDDVYANGFTVAIDQNITVRSLKNRTTPSYFLNNAIPIMTSPTLPSGTVTSSGTSVGNAYEVFDRAESEVTFSSSNVATITYRFSTPKVIIRYAFLTAIETVTNSRPSTWTFDGSNNGSTWTTLHSVSTAANLFNATWYNYSFSNSTSYEYYRLNVTAAAVYNANIKLGELQMTEDSVSAIGGNTGGLFTLSAGYTINADIIVQGPGTLLSYTASSPTVATINGNVTMRVVYGSTTIYGISHTGTGTLTINGNISNAVSSTGPTNAFGIYCSTSNGTININGNITSQITTNRLDYLFYVASNFTINIVGNVTNNGYPTTYTGSATISLTTPCTLNIIGDIYGSNAGFGTNLAYTTNSIYCTAAASINITGDVYGHTGSPVIGSGQNSIYSTILLTAAANMVITGNVVGGGGTGHAIFTTSSPVINVTGKISGAGAITTYLNGNGGSLSCTGVITAGGANAVFVNSRAILCTLSGPFINNTSGIMAVNAPMVFLVGSPTRWYLTNSVGGDRTLYSSDFAPGYPDIQNVRSGVSYNGGTMTGTMVVPPASSVASGVPVDATTGTAFITSAQVGQAVWDYLITNIADPNSIGYRLKDASTVTTTGSQIQALNGL